VFVLASSGRTFVFIQAQLDEAVCLFLTTAEESEISCEEIAECYRARNPQILFVKYEESKSIRRRVFLMTYKSQKKNIVIESP
jgi:hypothetical protein